MARIERAARKTRKKRIQATRRKPAGQGFVRHFNGLNFPWKAFAMMVLGLMPLILIFSTYRWINDPENLTITAVEVKGNLKVLDQSMLQPVIEAYAKTNLYLLDAKGLEQKLEQNPWVHSASLTRVWPTRLIVKIVEEKPVAFWGDKAMLTQQGKVINAVLASRKGVLPLLYSPEKKGRNMASGFLKIREWMKDFPVRLVEFKEDARGSWQIKLENGLVVKIGRHQHERRIRRFMVGYRQKLARVVDSINTVDLRYTNGFAVKWKKGQSADRLIKG